MAIQSDSPARMRQLQKSFKTGKKRRKKKKEGLRFGPLAISRTKGLGRDERTVDFFHTPFIVTDRYLCNHI
jgi:hypothetical protein